jgi:hypothetical protein
MRHTHYYRMTLTALTPEFLPFSAAIAGPVPEGLTELEALRLINKWNALAMGRRFTYWL